MAAETTPPSSSQLTSFEMLVLLTLMIPKMIHESMADAPLMLTSIVGKNLMDAVGVILVEQRASLVLQHR